MTRSLILLLATLCLLAATGAPASAAPAAGFPGTGSYLIGRDVQPGVYRARARGAAACYWHRTRPGGEIVAHDIGDGQRIVYLRPSDRRFRSSGCTRWRRVFDSVLASTSARTRLPGDGVFLVGPDFVPGTYTSSGNTAACYWQRSSSADGATGHIIANGIAKGDLTVTIDPSDAVFGTSRCRPWVRAGPPEDHRR